MSGRELPVTLVIALLAGLILVVAGGVGHRASAGRRAAAARVGAWAALWLAADSAAEVLLNLPLTSAGQWPGLLRLLVPSLLVGGLTAAVLGPVSLRLRTTPRWPRPACAASDALALFGGAVAGLSAYLVVVATLLTGRMSTRLRALEVATLLAVVAMVGGGAAIRVRRGRPEPGRRVLGVAAAGFAPIVLRETRVFVVGGRSSLAVVAALLALGIAAALVALGRPGERAGRSAVLGACCAAACARTALLLAVVTPGWALGAALACAVLLPAAIVAAVRSEPAVHARQVSG